MSKKKDEKSLLEVLGLHREGQTGRLEVPDWINRPGQALSTQGTSDSPEIPAAPPVVSPAGTITRSVARSTTQTSGKIISLSDGRINISLNQVSATVALLAIILMITTAFFLGRRTAANPPVKVSPASGVKEVPYRPDVADIGPKRPRVLPVPHLPAGGTKTNPPIGAKRQKGLHYLVIQGGITSRAEAEDIQRFLYSKGINTTVERMSINKYMVKDLRGFKNLRSPETRAELARYVEQIERLGREYQRQGGRWGFKQSKTAPLPWMEKER